MLLLPSTSPLEEKKRHSSQCALEHLITYSSCSQIQDSMHFYHSSTNQIRS